MTVSPSVLGFTALIVVVTAIAFGIAPALQGTRPDLTALLNDSARGSSSGTARQRLRLVLVAGQTGVAMILLITAGLLINSFLKLKDNDLGADPEGVLTFQVRFAQNKTITFTGQQHKGVGLWNVNPRVGLTVERIFDEIKTIPGIEAASVANSLPFQGAPFRSLLVDGRPTDDLGAAMNGAYLAVMPGYFEALKIGVRRGRALEETDIASGRPVVVINDAMAKQYWKDRDPIGSYITLDFVPGEQPREVVGVVSNVLLNQYAETAAPALYVPYGQQTDLWLGPQWQQRAYASFIVKGRDDPMDLVPFIRGAVARVDDAGRRSVGGLARHLRRNRRRARGRGHLRRHQLCGGAAHPRDRDPLGPGCQRTNDRCAHHAPGRRGRCSGTRDRHQRLTGSNAPDRRHALRHRGDGSAHLRGRISTATRRGPGRLHRADLARSEGATIGSAALRVRRAAACRHAERFTVLKFYPDGSDW
jgi:hypothetical protein